jgi:hypothetical protein
VCTLISQNVKKERVLESTVSLPPRGFESLRVNEVQGFLAKERYSDATRVRFAGGLRRVPLPYAASDPNNDAWQHLCRNAPEGSSRMESNPGRLGTISSG